CFYVIFFFSSRRRHTRFSRDWSSDVCSSDLSYSPYRESHPIRLKPRSLLLPPKKPCPYVPRPQLCPVAYRCSPIAHHRTPGFFYQEYGSQSHAYLGRICSSLCFTDQTLSSYRHPAD